MAPGHVSRILAFPRAKTRASQRRNTMKANPINTLLDECRAGKTSDEHSRSVERIDQKIFSLQDECATFSVQLQEAMPTATTLANFTPR